MRAGLYLLRERDGRRLPVVVHEAGHGVVAGEEVPAEVIRGHFYAGRLRPASIAEFEVAVEALGRARGPLDQAPPAIPQPAPAERREPLVIAPRQLPARTIDLTRAAELLAAARGLSEADLTAAAELGWQLRAEQRRLEAEIDAALLELRAILAEATSRANAVEGALLDAARAAEARARDELLALGVRRITTPGGVTASLREGPPEVVVVDRRAAAQALLEEIDDAAVLKAARAAVRAGRTVPGVEIRPRVEARVTGPRGGAS